MEGKKRRARQDVSPIAIPRGIAAEQSNNVDRSVGVRIISDGEGGLIAYFSDDNTSGLSVSVAGHQEQEEGEKTGQMAFITPESSHLIENQSKAEPSFQQTIESPIMQARHSPSIQISLGRSTPTSESSLGSMLMASTPPMANEPLRGSAISPLPIVPSPPPSRRASNSPIQAAPDSPTKTPPFQFGNGSTSNAPSRPIARSPAIRAAPSPLHIVAGPRSTTASPSPPPPSPLGTNQSNKATSKNKIIMRDAPSNKSSVATAAVEANPPSRKEDQRSIPAKQQKRAQEAKGKAFPASRTSPKATKSMSTAGTAPSTVNGSPQQAKPIVIGPSVDYSGEAQVDLEAQKPLEKRRNLSNQLSVLSGIYCALALLILVFL